MGPEELEVVERKALQRFQDLDVYREGFRLAMEIFKMTQAFPREELYALTTQMRNASRSVPANIAEGWAKRRHALIFKRHLVDALGSSNELLVWLDTALASGYVASAIHRELYDAYEVLAKRLYRLLTTWRTF